MKKMPCLLCLIFLFLLAFSSACLKGEESLFNPEVVNSSFVQKMFSFIDNNRNKIIEEWISLTEIPAPSGFEKKRALYLKKQFETCGLDKVFIDSSGNAVGIWEGSPQGKKIILSAHMDTVFQGVWKIIVKREGNLLKAPGIGDDTASLINLLWSVRALKYTGFKPSSISSILSTALATAHTMQSRDVPNPNVAVAKAVERIDEIELPSSPIEKWTILNIGMIGGGKVRNAVSQESYFTVDLRSANQEELEKAQRELRRICQEVAEEEGVMLEMDLNDESKAHQIPGAAGSFLVRTVVDILHYLQIRDVEANPLGSTEANVGIKKGILSINLGRTYGRYKHTLHEEAEIDGLFLAMKQILLLVHCLK